PPGQILENTSPKSLDRWQKPGDKASFAKYTTLGGPSTTYFALSDAIYSDGSFIRLSNVSLAYDVYGKTLKSLGLKSAKFYLRAQNLFLITNYDGLDPLTPVFGAVPPYAVFIGGVQINF
ncbi:MAG: hypothetical protein J7497_11460, partial [Chitinophagaceae bacterium]|nr:hypothetical protein [Chitinophagaceae bacterium]